MTVKAICQRVGEPRPLHPRKPPVREYSYLHVPFDFRNKTPYPRRPLRTVKKSAMTIAVGILAEGSIVLASDSKYATGGVVNYGQKIFPLPKRESFRVVVAGAGVVSSIKAAAEKINLALPNGEASLDDIQAAVEAANKNYYEEFIDRLSDPARYELLVGIAHHGEGCRLLQCSQNSTLEVKEYALLGTGGLTAQPYADLWWPDISILEAENMAVCLVKYAKTYDEFCGGETKVFTLRAHDIFLELNADYIRYAEDYFVHFHRLAVGMLLPFGSLKADSEFFEGKISMLISDLKRYRENLFRSHQGSYRRIP